MNLINLKGYKKKKGAIGAEQKKLLNYRKEFKHFLVLQCLNREKD